MFAECATTHANHSLRELRPKTLKNSVFERYRVLLGALIVDFGNVP